MSEEKQPNNQTRSESRRDFAGAIEGQGKSVWRREGREKRRGSKRAGYVGAIITSIILLFVFNNLLNWNVPFLTEEFTAALWVFNVSFTATIAGNLLFLVYDANWFRHLAQLILNVVAFLAFFTLYVTFPFDFSSASVGLLVRIALIAVLIGIAIGTIVEFFKLILNID